MPISIIAPISIFVIQANDTLRRDRRNAKPRPAKPISIIAQVEGSGTVTAIIELLVAAPVAVMTYSSVSEKGNVNKPMGGTCLLWPGAVNVAEPMGVVISNG